MTDPPPRMFLTVERRADNGAQIIVRREISFMLADERYLTDLGSLGPEITAMLKEIEPHEPT